MSGTPSTLAGKTVDFGAPTSFGAHVFRIEIPASRTDEVIFTEDYGYRGLEGGIPKEEERVVLKRGVWSAIAETDRLLGKELCVLAWAAETAADPLLPIICSKWAALRPEERWWLFSMTVAEAGLAEDTERGWRRALFHALSDGEKPAESRKRRPRPVERDLFAATLFQDVEP
jgi:hypothetical protein